ncbi:hypothetical protein [Pseudomonas leptonychotis]|uniref:hypothetical protein n=1 Tax=Pseudomonas leptonychotis TaxID=2448482 RepID=UPI0039F069B3
MPQNDLCGVDFAALSANYPELYPARFKKAQRIRAHVALKIEYQLMVSRRISDTDANAPVEIRRWKRAIIHDGYSALDGVRLHVPKRLQALLSLSHHIHLDCLIWGNEAWLLAFESHHVAGLQHDLLAEWHALTAMQPVRRLSAQEERIYAPFAEPLEEHDQSNWLIAATAIMCGGMLILSYLDISFMGLLPLALGLSIILWQLRLELFPPKRSGRLLRIERPLERINLRNETPIHWYRCGELLIKQDYDVLEPDAGYGGLIYVDTSPGHLQIKLARIGQRLMAWRCRDSFLAWLHATLEPWLIALPLILLVLISLVQLLLVATESFDPWLLGYSLLGAGTLMTCWHRWSNEAKRSLIACFDTATG